jgi:hypothetical protein
VFYITETTHEHQISFIPTSLLVSDTVSVVLMWYLYFEPSKEHVLTALHVSYLTFVIILTSFALKVYVSR